jgi:hypothetical protein
VEADVKLPNLARPAAFLAIATSGSSLAAG